MHRAHGISLVELLVALALSSLLSAVMVVAYTGSRQHYFYQEQSARLQENGRHAMRLLARELSMAGFYGGAAGLRNSAPGRPAGDCGDRPWALVTRPAIDLVNDAVTGDLPRSVYGRAFSCVAANELVNGSDVLAIRRSASRASVLRGTADSMLSSSTVRTWYLRTESGNASTWEQWRPRNP